MQHRRSCVLFLGRMASGHCLTMFTCHFDDVGQRQRWLQASPKQRLLASFRHVLSVAVVMLCLGFLPQVRDSCTHLCVLSPAPFLDWCCILMLPWPSSGHLTLFALADERSVHKEDLQPDKHPSLGLHEREGHFERMVYTRPSGWGVLPVRCFGSIHCCAHSVDQSQFLSFTGQRSSLE